MDDFEDDEPTMEEITLIYNKNLMNLETLITEHDSLAVAGVLLAQALSIYRTALSDEDYEDVIKEIVKRKNSVKKITNGSVTLQ